MEKITNRNGKEGAKMIYKFTVSSEKVLQIAKEIAEDLGHNYIGTEHVLYGLVKEKNGVAAKILKNQKVTDQQVLAQIEELIGNNQNGNETVLGFTPRTKRVIENAYLEAKKVGSDYIGTEHFLIGILREADSIAMRILDGLHVKLDNIYHEITKIVNEFDSYVNFTQPAPSKESSSYSVTPTLNQFSHDLTKEAKEGMLDPVIGRNIETERVIEILSRRTKNNPCLIGEPGVGKTAVVEGLAQKIVTRQYP